MDRKHNIKNVANAKTLRKNMTKEERRLWYEFLRNYPIRFYRQKVLGKYIVDFYCAKAKLVIELDGSQHYEDKAFEYDKERARYLEDFGLKVVRFTNYELNKNFRGVCEYIDMLVSKDVVFDNPSVSFADSSPYTGEP